MTFTLSIQIQHWFPHYSAMEFFILFREIKHYKLTLSSHRPIQLDAYANSVAPDEMVRDKQYYQNCLPFCYWFLTETPMCPISEMEDSIAETQGLNPEFTVVTLWTCMFCIICSQN